MILSRRRALAGALALTASPLAPGRAAEAGETLVYDGPQLAAALRAALGGDTITLAPGTYAGTGPLRLTAPGVTLRAAIPLAATLLVPLEILAPAAVVQGLALAGAGIRVAADAARVLGCRVGGAAGVSIQILRGAGVEVGHCEIAAFKGRGISVKLWRANGPTSPWIHHNHIHDVVGGGGEGIQLAEAMKDSATRLGAVVEYNLLERVEAESEAVSVKCSGNQVRFNTLQDSRAYIVNRHGQGNTYAGNTVQRAYGIAIQDGGCRLLGNRCTGSILRRSIRLLCGDVDAGSTRQGSHPAAADTYLCGNVADYLIVGDQFSGGFRVPVARTLIAGHTGPVVLRSQTDTRQDAAPEPVPEPVLLTAADVGPPTMA